MKIVENVFPSFHKVIVGFDVEWTKNYRITNGNRAFCFSLVSVRQDNYVLSLLEQELTFGFHLYYAKSEEECQQLCQHADRLVAQTLSEQNVIVGHQFSSDMSVLLACAGGSLPAIEALQHVWRTRNLPMQRNTVKIFDTRYDLGTPKLVFASCSPIMRGYTLRAPRYSPSLNLLGQWRGKRVCIF